ncbi:S8 family serine peptidase [candidate division WOR-3 bacterium]|nr:S8 family serine peptidase [candidate division WOR-3 bacterium]
MLVSATGNDNIFSPLYPAAYPNVIAVSATDRDDRKAWFTNYGGYIFCSAPGVGIYTTMLDNEYGLMSGTSASSAIVSGMIGLLLSKEPYLTPDEVMQRIQDYSDDIGLPGWDNVCGYGRINGFKLLFRDIPSYLALYGWEISGGNNNGYPEKGETFILKPIVKNIGVTDTLRGVYCIITTGDSLVEILDDICGIGDICPGEALKSPDGFSIKFSSDMPDKYISHILPFSDD